MEVDPFEAKEPSKNEETQVDNAKKDDAFKVPSLPSFQIKIKPKPIIKEPEEDPEPKKPPVNFPYEPPPWKGLPDERFYIEELKNGTIQRTIELNNKPFITIGRLESCDIDLAHPTVSRFHAVFQYRGISEDNNEKGFYIYDLGSTHGTFLNKYRIKSKVYVRIKVGHVVKFGSSTRLFCFLGPQDDQEEESELSITELKSQRMALIQDRLRKEKEDELKEKEEIERQERLIEERGISWGMAEDADEESDLTENPYAVLTNEEFYIDDPKKALKMWYEREGQELNFQSEKAEKGVFVSKLVLPIDDEEGQEIIIETSARNKKESLAQCALEACRAIDKMGLLKPSKRESKKVQKRNWEDNDYYDSDEDSFLDRTGDLDKKREKRMKKAGKIQETIETYDSLMEKHKEIFKKIEKAEIKLNEITNISSTNNIASEDVDELDAYMMTLNQSKPKKIDIKIAKDELHLLKEEEVRLRKLINIAKPTNMPELVQPVIRPKEKIEKVKTVTTPVAIEKPKINPVKKVIGPSLPLNLVKTDDDKKKEITIKPKKEVLIKDEEYDDKVWEPPKGQTGDGRTHLNDKFGY